MAEISEYPVPNDDKKARLIGTPKAMEEISESPALDDDKKASEQKTELSYFDPETMRKTKPGAKRLIITCTVLLSFLIGLPFLLKSVEIYRSPLPFRDIDSLSAELDSSRILFPCHFHVVLVNFTLESAEQLRHSIHIQEQLQPAHCSTCNSTVAITLDSGFDCRSDNRYGWKCKVLNEFKCDRNLRNCDEEFDEFLDDVLKNIHQHDKEKVYTVVVVNGNDVDEVRGVVGKHRHAWIEGRNLKEAEMVQRIAEIFIKVFVNGGKEDGSVRGEFMPVGADERVVLSFSLLNSDPLDWVYDWDFQDMEERLLAPVVDALRPLADVSVESQVLYHTPKSSHSNYDDKVGGYLFNTQDLPFFVNSNEWHLDTSIAAGGRSKVLQFVVYVPSARECPLLLQLPNGDFSSTNGFISPMWGGVVVWNPPSCSTGLQHAHHPQRKISPDDLKKTFEVFLGQLRQLFGLNSNRHFSGSSGTFLLLASENGFTEWELDVLSRQHACFNLLQIGRTLGSLSRLVQSLPRMIIKDEIGKQVGLSLEAAKLALSNASLGIYDASAVLSRHSRSFAEDAFYHPSMMSVSYYSFEHCFAVYSPFFLPASLHVLLAVVKEMKRYKQEKKKYTTWKSKLGATTAF